MRTKILRAAAAVLVVLGLLAPAAPAASTLDRGDPRAESEMGPSLLQQLTDWFAGLWPGLDPAAPEGAAGLAQRLGSRPDPDGDPAAAGPASSGDDDPTAEPQLGPAPDPNG